MNISVIKENKFWFGIGGIVTVLLLLYIFFAHPYRQKNTRNLEAIENILSQLQMYEMKGFKIINEEWIKDEKVKLEMIRKERQRNIELLTERDLFLEKIFGSENEGEITDVALWKSRYIQRVSLLRNNLEKSNLSISAGALSFKEWGDEIPTWDSIVKEQKMFWIEEELLNIMENKELKIRNIISIRFSQGDLTPGMSSDLYDIIPCTISVSMDIEQVLFFIHELLRSKLCFEIDTVDIEGKLKKTRTLSVSSGAGNSSSDSTVNITINTHVIDFKT